MEMNIGANIKKLRTARGLTQEQLAELLNVSSAAVSKWEVKNTYPDITMLFPLAHIFGVSLDELMGYDEAKIKEEIERLLDSYHAHSRNGEFTKAREIIESARQAYPNDYKIMLTYMWAKADGSAGNNPAILLENREEFLQICDCILNGCTEENLRIEALTMKAKLLHAAGDTAGALKIFEAFPSWFHSTAQKTEQLFAKDTPEYRYWNKRNAYGLLDFMASKLSRIFRYDDCLSLKEKISRMEALGDAFSTLRKQEGLEFFSIPEHMVYAELSTMLTWEGADIKEILRTREKQFSACKAMTELAKQDEILREMLFQTYKTDDLVHWTVNSLTNAQHTPLARLREIPAYRELLEKWSK